MLDKMMEEPMGPWLQCAIPLKNPSIGIPVTNDCWQMAYKYGRPSRCGVCGGYWWHGRTVKVWNGRFYDETECRAGADEEGPCDCSGSNSILSDNGGEAGREDDRTANHDVGRTQNITRSLHKNYHHTDEDHGGERESHEQFAEDNWYSTDQHSNCMRSRIESNHTMTIHLHGETKEYRHIQQRKVYRSSILIAHHHRKCFLSASPRVRYC